ncbi:MAG: 3'-5' exonuclease [Akkermansiaceae bacterium]
MNFVAIDFETANGARNSACAVGIVTVKDGIITDTYYTLIKPPRNAYHWGCIRVHGIKPADTISALTFAELYPEFQRRLQGQTVVAHNAPFDRGVLRACMDTAALDYNSLEIHDKWQCTVQIYRKKGFKPCNLNACCEVLGIELQHHQALSDAKACAELYLRK